MLIAKIVACALLALYVWTLCGRLIDAIRDWVIERDHDAETPVFAMETGLNRSHLERFLSESKLPREIRRDYVRVDSIQNLDWGYVTNILYIRLVGLRIWIGPDSRILYVRDYPNPTEPRFVHIDNWYLTDLRGMVRDYIKLDNRAREYDLKMKRKDAILAVCALFEKGEIEVRKFCEGEI